MLWTTVPSFIIALGIFYTLGINNGSQVVVSDIVVLQNTIKDTFTINPFMLVPLALLLFMAIKKLPALSSLIVGTLVGCLFAILFQWEVIINAANDSSLSPIAAAFKGLFSALYLGYSSNSGNEALDSLLSKGGMGSMLYTIGLIVNAMAFGGTMAKTGLLQRLVQATLSRVKTAGGLISATVGSCIGTNIAAADQYLSVVIPGQMFVNSYKERNLNTLNLSRTLEDSGTLTSALIPWNTCGAYLTATLGVSTFAYAPYAFFNICCPIIAIIYGYTNFKLLTEKPEAA